MGTGASIAERVVRRRSQSMSSRSPFLAFEDVPTLPPSDLDNFLGGVGDTKRSLGKNVSNCLSNYDNGACSSNIEEGRHVEVDLKICCESEDSKIADSHPACRFCLEVGDLVDQEGFDLDECKLVIPCDCKGTAKFVHLGCLRRFVFQKLGACGTFESNFNSLSCSRMCDKVAKADHT
jgi:hypothetical protein